MRLALLLLTACATRTWEVCEDAPPPSPDAALAWHADARPIVEARCARCHVDGGPAPFALTSLPEVRPWLASVHEVVEARTMPPWLAAECCESYRFHWGLTPDERSTLLAWIDQGAVEGEPSTWVAPEHPLPGLDRVDRTLTMAEPYTPSPPAGTTDESRCFLLDWPDDAPRYVTGVALRPGNPTVVHHALLLVAGPTVVAQFQALDQLGAGPGWSCPGGLVLGYTGWLGGWSPGWEGTAFPDGLGQEVEPGSKLILAVHYSVTTADPGPDQTSVDLRLDDDVTGGLGVVSLYDPLWLTGGLRIPAGEPDVVHSYRARPPALQEGTRLMAVNLHMHERGLWGQVGIEHADGSTDCLLNVPSWDYEWQNDYWLAEPRRWLKGDRLFVECHWDNTSGNQRLVDGQPEPPRDLNWAEDGEMCIAAVTFAAP